MLELEGFVKKLLEDLPPRHQDKPELKEVLKTIQKLNEPRHKRLRFQGNIELAERSDEIEKFSEDTRKELVDRGFVIYTINKVSLKALSEATGQLHFHWWAHETEMDFKDEIKSLVSNRASEVAFYRHDPILRKGEILRVPAEITLADAASIAEAYTQRISIARVKAIIGETTDYVQVLLKHLNETGEILLEDESRTYSYPSVITTGPLLRSFTRDEFVSTVGPFFRFSSDERKEEKPFLMIGYEGKDRHDIYTKFNPIFPLVVPNQFEDDDISH